MNISNKKLYSSLKKIKFCDKINKNKNKNMGGKGPEGKGAELQESLTKNPAYEAGIVFITHINDLMGKKDAEAEEIICKENPKVDALLKFVGDLEGQNAAFEEAEKKGEIPPYGDLNHITKVTHDKEKGILTLCYDIPDNPDYADLNIEIIKGAPDNIYDAIFWKELQAEALQKAQEGKGKVTEQGTTARRDTALDAGKPLKEKSPVEEKTKPDPTKTILIGDSLTYHYERELREQEDIKFNIPTSQNKKYVNPGKSAIRMNQDLKALQKTGELTDITDAVICGGANDLTTKTADEIISALTEMTELLTKKQPPAHVTLITLPPVHGYKEFQSNIEEIMKKVDKINNWIREIAKSNPRNITVLDLYKMAEDPSRPGFMLKKYYSDGLHLSKEGKIDMAKGIYDILCQKPSASLAEGDKTQESAEAQAPGELHLSYLKQVESVQESVAESDVTTLQGAKIEDVRYNTRLLKPKPKDKEETNLEQASSLKEETYRRLRAYTSSFNGQWYTLNYARMGSDKTTGLTHEMNIGLGDILLDPDVQNVLVEQDGQMIQAHRGVVASGRHKGRVGFLRNDTNEYVATFTGDRFRILTKEETDFKNTSALTTYLGKVKEEDTARGEHKKTFQKELEMARAGFDFFNEDDVSKFIAERKAIEAKLDPAEISKIPQTERVQEIPEKPKGAKRMVIFGDTNGKKDGEEALKALQAQMPSWNADFVLGLGDYLGIPSGTNIENEAQKQEMDKKYQELMANMKGLFGGFKDTPMALALGNHDKNPTGNTDDLKTLFQERLEKQFEYQESEDKSAYSYKMGNATFVVFNEGRINISDSQVDFFKKTSKSAPGAVYLVNHVPPIQHSYGSGLPEDGSESSKNFEKIQQIAKENVEGKGNPFYIIGGHDHFHTVIGNFIDPGGMGLSYYGLNGKLRSNPSAAVVDMDENGKILAVYFRDAKSDFKDPLPEIQDALAWGKESTLKERIPSFEINPVNENKIVATLERNVPGEGQKIMDYSKRICKELGLSTATLWAMTWVESGYNPNAYNREKDPNGSSATGLTQFLDGSWEGFMKHCSKTGIHHPEWDLPCRSDPKEGFVPSRFNAYASLYAAAHNMTSTREGLGLHNKTTQEAGTLYYLAHHEGLAGAKAYLKFLDIMREAGYKEAAEIADLYNTDKAKFDELTSGVFVGSQPDRLSKHGISKFLSVYYRLSQGVGLRAAASTIDKPPEEKQEEPKLVAEATPGSTEKVSFKFDGKNGLVDLKGNQDTWILGSSTAYGMHGLTEGNTGICGIIGANTKNFFSKFKEQVWPRIEHLPLPRQVVLTGLSTNGLNPEGSIETTVRRNIEGYLAIAKFFEDKGVKVRITTAAPYQKKLPQIMAFNETLRTKYPQYCLDVASHISTPDGKDWLPGMMASDGLHMSRKASRIAGRIINESAVA